MVGVQVRRKLVEVKHLTQARVEEAFFDTTEHVRFEVGAVQLTETPHGVLLRLALKGGAPGEHAFHIHAVGKCEPPFTSAGGHFNPASKKHGLAVAEGSHAGDMPNLHIPASGELVVEILNGGVTLAKGKPNSVFDTDGSAIVIHAGVDDYKSDPTGNAGDRIACGVIVE